MRRLILFSLSSPFKHRNIYMWGETSSPRCSLWSLSGWVYDSVHRGFDIYLYTIVSLCKWTKNKSVESQDSLTHMIHFNSTLWSLHWTESWWGLKTSLSISSYELKPPTTQHIQHSACCLWRSCRWQWDERVVIKWQTQNSSSYRKGHSAINRCRKVHVFVCEQESEHKLQ